MADTPSGFRADQLRRIRQRNGLTRAQLALLAGVSPETVRNAESQARTPSARVMRALADALQVPIDMLAPTKGSRTLAELRARTGLTQKQTAAVIGVSSGMVSKVESGIYGVRRPEKWAAGYRVSETVWMQAWQASRDVRRRKITKRRGREPS